MEAKPVQAGWALYPNRQFADHQIAYQIFPVVFIIVATEIDSAAALSNGRNELETEKNRYFNILSTRSDQLDLAKLIATNGISTIASASIQSWRLTAWV